MTYSTAGHIGNFTFRPVRVKTLSNSAIASDCNMYTCSCIYACVYNPTHELHVPRAHEYTSLLRLGSTGISGLGLRGLVAAGYQLRG